MSECNLYDVVYILKFLILDLNLTVEFMLPSLLSAVLIPYKYKHCTGHMLIEID